MPAAFLGAVGDPDMGFFTWAQGILQIALYYYWSKCARDFATQIEMTKAEQEEEGELAEVESQQEGPEEV